MRSLFPSALGAALVLAGCVTTYKGPVSGTPTAKLRVVHNQPDAFLLQINAVDAERCKRGAFMGHVSGAKKPDEQRVGMLDPRPVADGTMERMIPAQQKFTVSYLAIPKLSTGEIVGMIAGAAVIGTVMGTPTSSGAYVGAMQGGQPGKACRTPIFTPEPGGEYEMTFDTPAGGCSITVTRLTSNGGKIVRTPVTPTATFGPTFMSYSCTDA